MADNYVAYHLDFMKEPLPHLPLGFSSTSEWYLVVRGTDEMKSVEEKQQMITSLAWDILSATNRAASANWFLFDKARMESTCIRNLAHGLFEFHTIFQ